MTKKNRSLDTIADEIHKAEKLSLFDIGELLLEAKESCEPGKWIEWFSASGFSFSLDLAERRINAATLSRRFRESRNLNAPATVIYYLSSLDESDWPTAVSALRKATKNRRVKLSEGTRIIDLALLARDHGKLPDETLLAIGEVNQTPFISADVKARTIAALKETPEAANAILAKFIESEEPEESDPDRDPESEESDSDPKPEEPTPALSMPPELIEALQTVLKFAERRPHGNIRPLGAVDLTIIADFVTSLAKALSGDDPVKIAADRAEARSRAQRAA